MKTPESVSELIETIQNMEHRERIVLKCNPTTDAEFQEPVSMEIYTTVQHLRKDGRKNHRINYVNEYGNPVPSSKMFNKFSTHLDEIFVIEEIFNKVSGKKAKPTKSIKLDKVKSEDEFVAVVKVIEKVKTPAEILSDVASETPKTTRGRKPKADDSKTEVKATRGRKPKADDSKTEVKATRGRKTNSTKTEKAVASN